MISAPVLQMPDFSKEFIVKTDAAVKFGIGGVLSQKDDKGTEHVVAYFSRKLSAAQRNYSVTEVELLAALEENLIPRKESDLKLSYSSEATSENIIPKIFRRGCLTSTLNGRRVK